VSDSRARARVVFVALSLMALACARCAAQSEVSPGQAPPDAAGDATPPPPPPISDAAPDAVACSSDVKTDPKNCGRCGHDCLGGGCRLGTCQPVVLASEQMRPTEIALDATHVYFAAAAENAVRRVAVQGGPAELLTVDATLDSNIAIDDAYVYFMTGFVANGGVGRAPKTGVPDGGTSTMVGTATFPLGFLAIDAENVYWTGGRFSGGPIQGGVYLAPKAVDGGLGVKVTGASVVAKTTSVAVDDTNLYFANAAGRIFWLTKGSTLGAPLASSQAGATGLVADGKRVYWANSGTGSILAIDKPSLDAGAGAGVVTVLASGQNTPARVALDDVAIYFTNTGSGTIGSCPLSGCTDVVRLVASAQAAPLGIAVDAVAIYWANSGDGTIMKVAK
jgi:hypothetical protein